MSSLRFFLRLAPLLLVLGWLPVAPVTWQSVAADAEVDASANIQQAERDADSAPVPLETRRDDKTYHEVIKFGESFVLDTDETAEQVVVLGGSATIKGKVRGDLVVVAGSAKIEGEVAGDMVVVLGSASLRSKAKVGGDAVTVGGSIRTEPGGRIGGDRQEITLGFVFPDLGWISSYLSQGVFMARPFPPRVAWAWVVFGLFLLLYLLLALIFSRPVKVCVDELDHRPVASFFTGVLALLLVGPLIIVLMVSVLGILVVPVVLCALLLALVFGKVAVYSFSGAQIGRHTGVELLQAPLVAFLIGAVLFTVLYMVPIVGFLVWGAVLPLGVGAVALAALRSLQTEQGPSTLPAQAVLQPVGANPSNPSPDPSTTPPPLSAGVHPAAAVAGGMPAGFWIRFAATALDAVLVFAIGSFVGPVVMLLWVAYHIVMWALKATTIGGIVLGLKVVRLDGRPVDFATALVRSLSSVFSAMVLFLGFFWAGWDRNRQSWHDKIAGTVIVRVPSGMSLI